MLQLENDSKNTDAFKSSNLIVVGVLEGRFDHVSETLFVPPALINNSFQEMQNLSVILKEQANILPATDSTATPTFSPCKHRVVAISGSSIIAALPGAVPINHTGPVDMSLAMTHTIVPFAQLETNFCGYVCEPSLCLPLVFLPILPDTLCVISINPDSTRLTVYCYYHWISVGYQFVKIPINYSTFLSFILLSSFS